MNIEEYRAMKAQMEKEEQDGTPQLEQPEKVEEIIEEIKEDEIKEEPKIDEPKDYMIEVNGEKINIDELKNGYLRQSDYTKKTQKLASEKKEIDDALRFYNEVKNNPEALESLKENVNVPRRIDPNQAKMVKLEEELYDMKLENEIRLMTSKYDDFEVKDVLTFASEKKMSNLEDAYVLLKSTKGTSSNNNTPKHTTMEQMKEDLKKEIMAEMKKSTTSSIISSKRSDNVKSTDEIKISEVEKKVAEGMGMSGKEYAKWRDANK